MNFLILLVQQFLAIYSVSSVFASTGTATIDIQNFVIDFQTFFIIKIVIAVLSAGIAVWLIVLSNRLADLNRQITETVNVPPAEPALGGPLQNRWGEILKHLDSVHEGEWKYSVIEADKLVDDQLKLYFAGETMGERMMGLDKTKLLTIDGLWEAHKIRNQLAHDTNYFLRHAEAVRAVKLYEQTLQELGAIQ